MVFSSPRSAGLSRLDISSRPAGCPRQSGYMCFVDKQNDRHRGENDLRHQPIEAFSKLTFHRRTGLQCAQVKGHDIGFSACPAPVATMRSASPSISALYPRLLRPLPPDCFTAAAGDRSSGRFHSRGTVPSQSLPLPRASAVMFWRSGQQGVAGFRCAGVCPPARSTDSADSFVPCCEILL